VTHHGGPRTRFIGGPSNAAAAADRPGVAVSLAGSHQLELQPRYQQKSAAVDSWSTGWSTQDPLLVHAVVHGRSAV
jgi:hypothetical protein